MPRWKMLLWGAAAALAFARCAASYAAALYPLAPGQRLIGEVQTYVTKRDETLLDVARDHDLGYTQLMAANQNLDPWLPGEGARVLLPTRYLLPDAPHRGIVINLAQQRLYYFLPKGDAVETFPIGVGVQGWVTPLGDTRVVSKVANPAWYPPKSIRMEEPGLPRMVPPGPDDPLGRFALFLGWPSYLIHGTNKPDGVGRNVSHGCIRLYPEDVSLLFEEVPVGTRVRVIDEEATIAWVGGALYLAAYPSKTQADELDVTGRFSPAPIPNLMGQIARLAGNQADRINWDSVRRAESERTGIPIQVTDPARPSNAARTIPPQD